MENFFSNIYGNAQIPVVVCERMEKYPVVFANASAKMLIDPLLSKDQMKANAETTFLQDVLRMENEKEYESLLISMEAIGVVDHFRANLVDHENVPIPITISINLATLQGRSFYVLYLQEEADAAMSSVDINNAMTAIFQIANQTESAEEAIDKVLAFSGNLVQVSRVYIFEEISEEMTRNTYEWCAPGVEPAIENLQNLRKEDYDYDKIMSGGMYITDDIRDISDDESRGILEMQGIRSLAIIPMYHVERAVGYVGFDDCVNYRKWGRGEIALLKNIASVLVSLIVRRDSDLRLRRSIEVLQTISDNIENIIYVTDVETNELVFLNKTLADSQGRPVESMLGKPCWSVLQKGMDGMCSFCPIPKMKEEGYHENGQTYTWEFQNTLTGKWYLIKDSIIKWIDGRDVHIETATEITRQKLYEEQLKHYASTDMMTGAYNREWGYRIMQEMLHSAALDGSEVSIAFIDVDGLKTVNDTYGHDAGDDNITQVVRAIRESTRKSDVLCRWGGDEFVLMLRCGEEVARRILDSIQKRLDALNATGERPYTVGFSCGVTTVSGSAEASIDEVITLADKMMYDNKVKKYGERTE